MRMIKFKFIACLSRGLPKYIKTKGADHLLLPHSFSKRKSFSLLLEILGNMCIAIVRFRVDEDINFENNFSFVINPFSCMTKKSAKKLNTSSMEKSF